MDRLDRFIQLIQGLLVEEFPFGQEGIGPELMSYVLPPEVKVEPVTKVLGKRLIV